MSYPPKYPYPQPHWVFKVIGILFIVTFIFTVISCNHIPQTVINKCKNLCVNADAYSVTVGGTGGCSCIYVKDGCKLVIEQ